MDTEEEEDVPYEQLKDMSKRIERVCSGASFRSIIGDEYKSPAYRAAKSYTDEDTIEYLENQESIYKTRTNTPLTKDVLDEDITDESEEPFSETDIDCMLAHGILITEEEQKEKPTLVEKREVETKNEKMETNSFSPSYQDKKEDDEYFEHLSNAESSEEHIIETEESRKTNKIIKKGDPGPMEVDTPSPQENTEKYEDEYFQHLSENSEGEESPSKTTEFEKAKEELKQDKKQLDEIEIFKKPCTVTKPTPRLYPVKMENSKKPIITNEREKIPSSLYPVVIIQTDGPSDDYVSSSEDENSTLEDLSMVKKDRQYKRNVKRRKTSKTKEEIEVDQDDRKANLERIEKIKSKPAKTGKHIITEEKNEEYIKLNKFAPPPRNHPGGEANFQ
ncbi:hypothetical protein JTB14_018656 [Gonioctena quinquepunctata]|nr:hypothetical protein JTB14_018656 [Gonioctena quinquepunctata]